MRVKKEEQIDLLEIMHVILRKWWLLVLCFLIGAVCMKLYCSF